MRVNVGLPVCRVKCWKNFISIAPFSVATGRGFRRARAEVARDLALVSSSWRWKPRERSFVSRTVSPRVEREGLRFEPVPGQGDLREDARDERFNELLACLANGDRSALGELVLLVYGKLRLIARHQLARERRSHTLDSVALVNEAFLTLMGQVHLVLRDRSHFLAVAAQVMRRVLVDHARARNAAKRGGGAPPRPLDAASAVAAPASPSILALDAALERLSAVDAEASQIVELRYFTGATEDEMSRALGLSPATVRRRWAFARAWLERELRDDAEA